MEPHRKNVHKLYVLKKAAVHMQAVACGVQRKVYSSYHSRYLPLPVVQNSYVYDSRCLLIVFCTQLAFSYTCSAVLKEEIYMSKRRQRIALKIHLLLLFCGKPKVSFGFLLAYHSFHRKIPGWEYSVL